MQVRTAVLPAPRSAGSVTTALFQRVEFEYIGSSALTAIGPLTRRSYHFASPGVILTVDGRDAAALVRIPHLRRLQPQ